MARSIRIHFDEAPNGDVLLLLLTFLEGKFSITRDEIEAIGQLRGSRDWYVTFKRFVPLQCRSQPEGLLKEFKKEVYITSFRRKYVTIRLH